MYQKGRICEIMLKSIKDNYKYILFVMFIIILNGFLIINIRGKLDFNFVVITFIINIIVITLFACLFHNYEKIKIENIFLIMFIDNYKIILIIFVYYFLLIILLMNFLIL